MDVFGLRRRLIDDYQHYVTNFINIRDPFIRKIVSDEMDKGAFWLDPLIQLNPSFEPGEWIDELVEQHVLHSQCAHIFRKDKDKSENGRPLRLHRHQAEAVRIASEGHNYILTTGTGSGKSLAYIVPIVDNVLRNGTGQGIRAIVVYPMNALANSQFGELSKYLVAGYANGHSPVRFAKYTGQETETERHQIIANPPDILLTNYVMLELILTRPEERGLIQAAQGLQFLVLDELHTYRGRQGADVALLVRRVRDRLVQERLQCVGTSATLAGGGSFQERQSRIATIASQLFGTEFYPENIVGETLRRVTLDTDLQDEQFQRELRLQLSDPNYHPPHEFDAFCTDPLSIWIESTFGLTTELDSQRLIRAKPRTITGKNGTATELNEITELSIERCTTVIQESLMAGYKCQPNPETGLPPFAFRLHQFISRGDTVYASLEPEGNRYLTLNGQQFAPGSNRDKVLLPFCFCRECGQEYYVVRRIKDKDTGVSIFIPRELLDRQSDENGEAGYLYFSSTDPWPEDEDDLIDRVPEDWIEEGKHGRRIRATRRKDKPEHVYVAPDGHRVADGSKGQSFHFIHTPFRFCLHCGVSYNSYQSSDFGKLGALGTEGRSSATTVLSLSAILGLRELAGISNNAHKLLSFTDNRQDASLQAGHFNDFVEIGLLRSALYRAVQGAGAEGIQYDDLPGRVFKALNLPIEAYAADPEVKYRALEETQLALREVLAYRLYRDLRRGWRVSAPNLEQCGLLEIHYVSLEELCGASEEWANCHPALSLSSPTVRAKIARTLLDYMRRELAIKVDYLHETYQERIRQRSSQKLVEPWAIDENEQRLEHAAILYPRPSESSDYGGHVYLSGRGSFGLYLRRPGTFPTYRERITVDETGKIIADLLRILQVAGLVEIVREPANPTDVAGYQLPAAAMIWRLGDGTKPIHDPLRNPQASSDGNQTNGFFVEFYRQTAQHLVGLEAREHTAQVPYQEREKRENLFRNAKLPILYCSPTMELGVDISELNVVNMRNIPPTPANYAQRSGRAGRSGQPALVFSYCASGSPHDQYFFKRPSLMVAGQVSPPRLDLTNEDLIRAHIHAIWLAETQISLGISLRDILDLTGDEPTLDLQDRIITQMNDAGARRRARKRAIDVLKTLESELDKTDWYSDTWLDKVLTSIQQNFNEKCERWRSLYRAARAQAAAQNAIIYDATRSIGDKDRAKRLRAEAESQLRLLQESDNIVQSDFYSYRYFASEGFLPGYSFPRLPVSAFIPARRTKQRERDEFLSRPRFLAISEFGPRAIVYHEGARYEIHQVIMPVAEQGESLSTRRIKQCPNCGYLHPINQGDGVDLCERCGALLDILHTPLIRMQNVATRRRDRISSDEEERFRLGYEIRTGIRFPERDGQNSVQIADLVWNGSSFGRLTYARAATIWRINMGWARRKRESEQGFVLDLERGTWARNELVEEDNDDPLSARTQRVIPYVEDSRNCLLLEFGTIPEPTVMASLQAAFKHALQVQYQLEENELAAEPLPNAFNRRILLFYEAAEGGAGILRRLVEDRDALSKLSRHALDICHFDPDTGMDQHHAPNARETCEAACYDCLMSFNNQRDHRYLDRQQIRDVLLALTSADVLISPTDQTREDHLTRLLRFCESDLEREWLNYLNTAGCRLPSDAQKLIEECSTRVDFYYENPHAAIYIDGPHHQYPERQERDIQQAACLDENLGITVVRFGYPNTWGDMLAKYPYIFGKEA